MGLLSRTKKHAEDGSKDQVEQPSPNETSQLNDGKDSKKSAGSVVDSVDDSKAGKSEKIDVNPGTAATGSTDNVSKTDVTKAPDSVKTKRVADDAAETKPATDIPSENKLSQQGGVGVGQMDSASNVSDEDVAKGEAKQKLLGLLQGESITTAADEIYASIKEKAGIKLSDIAKQKNVPASKLKAMVDIMYRQKAVQIKYPLNVFSSPRLTATPIDRTAQSKLSKEKNTLLETYTLQTDNVVADVNIWTVPDEITPVYEIIRHRLGEGTEVIMQELVNELSNTISVTTSDISNPRKVIEFRSVFYERSLALIQKHFPTVNESTSQFLAGILVHRTYGMGDIEILMADDWLEEIAINGSTEPVSVYHKRYGWLKTTTFMQGEDEIYNFASQISRKIGKQINALNPIMDAHLQTGDRVAATLFPISTEGDTVTIRRFSRNPWTITHMIDPKINTMSVDVLAFLWEIVQYEMNYMVVGGTASGKTSVLNTLSSMIPPTNRVISIEDTREITLPKALHWNWVPMSSKSANTEGQGEVTMLDLMVASLRMRPDRIIVGEIRRKQQAEAMFEAMHTGHSVCATMHADTAEQIRRRLTQPPIDIPENEIQALQLVLVQYRDRRKGVRRTLEVAELLPGSSGEKVNLNYLYRWRPRSDRFIKDNDSIRIMEDLNLHTGMTQNELEDDLHQKQDILKWLLKNSIKDVDKIGSIMSIYYKFPDLLIDTVNDNGRVDNLLNNG